jgi:hypothetical protein
MPLKFKEFFVKAILAETEKGDLFGNISSPMLKIFVENASIDIACSIIKDFSVNPPLKQFITILTKILMTNADKPHLPQLRGAIVTSLNTMLIRTPKTDFCIAFQLQLPAFLKEYFKNESNAIFTNVPDQTKEELKKTFDRHISIRRM